MRSPGRVAAALLVIFVGGCGSRGGPGASGSQAGTPGTTFTVSVRGDFYSRSSPTADPVFLVTGGRVESGQLSANVFVPDGRIDCGLVGTTRTSACSADYPWGFTGLVLRATLDATKGMTYSGFAGACSGEGTCALEGNADKMVLVRFLARRTGHGNYSDAAVHGPAYRDFAAGVPGALQCTSCHGAALQGQGIAVSCSACHSWPRAASWRSAGTLPEARYGLSSVAYDNRVYILGGDLGANTQTNDVSSAAVLADGTLGPWIRARPFAGARQGHSTVAANGFLYVLGGGNGAVGQLADVQYARVLPDGNVGDWSPTTPLPMPRQDHRSLVYGNRIYVLGGNYGEAGVNWADTLYAEILPDGQLGPWVSTTPMPYATELFGAVAHGGQIYLLGTSPAWLSDAASHEVHHAPVTPDGAVGDWTLTTSFPRARIGFGVEVLDGAVHLFGGMTYTSCFSDMVGARISEGGGLTTWSDEADLPSCRAYLASTVTGGRVYALGGLQALAQPQRILDEVLVLAP